MPLSIPKDPPLSPMSFIPISLVPHWLFSCLASRNKLLGLLSPTRPQGSYSSRLLIVILIRIHLEFLVFSWKEKRGGAAKTAQVKKKKAIILIASYNTV